MATNHGDSAHDIALIGTNCNKLQEVGCVNMCSAEASESLHLSKESKLKETKSNSWLWRQLRPLKLWTTDSMHRRRTTIPSGYRTMFLVLGKIYSDLIKIVIFCALIDSCIGWVYCVRNQLRLEQAWDDDFVHKSMIWLTSINIAVIVLYMRRKGHWKLASETYQSIKSSRMTEHGTRQKIFPVRTTARLRKSTCPPDPCPLTRLPSPGSTSDSEDELGKKKTYEDTKAEREAVDAIAALSSQFALDSAMCAVPTGTYIRQSNSKEWVVQERLKKVINLESKRSGVILSNKESECLNRIKDTPPGVIANMKKLMDPIFNPGGEPGYLDHLAKIFPFLKDATQKPKKEHKEKFGPLPLPKRPAIPFKPKAKPPKESIKEKSKVKVKPTVIKPVTEESPEPSSTRKKQTTDKFKYTLPTKRVWTTAPKAIHEGELAESSESLFSTPAKTSEIKSTEKKTEEEKITTQEDISPENETMSMESSKLTTVTSHTIFADHPITPLLPQPSRKKRKEQRSSGQLIATLFTILVISAAICLLFVEDIDEWLEWFWEQLVGYWNELLTFLSTDMGRITLVIALLALTRWCLYQSRSPKEKEDMITKHEPLLGASAVGGETRAKERINISYQENISQDIWNRRKHIK